MKLDVVEVEAIAIPWSVLAVAGLGVLALLIFLVAFCGRIKFTRHD